MSPPWPSLSGKATAALVLCPRPCRSPSPLTSPLASGWVALADSALSLSRLRDGAGPVFPATHEVTAAAGHGHDQVHCPVLGCWPGSSWTHSGTVPPGPLAPLLPPGTPRQPWGRWRGQELCKIARALHVDLGHRPLDAVEVRGRGSQPARRPQEAPAWGPRSADSSPHLSCSLLPTQELRAWSPDAAWVGEGSRQWGEACLPASGWVMGRGCRPRGRWGGERGCRARQWLGFHPRAPGQGRASPSTFPHQLCTPTGPSLLSALPRARGTRATTGAELPSKEGGG